MKVHRSAASSSLHAASRKPTVSQGSKVLRPRTNIAVLVTDAFGGGGGIAQFNRDFLEALSASRALERIDVLPRSIPESTGSLPKSIVYDHAAARGKWAFGKRALAHAVGKQIDFVICGHLHLLPAAWLLARFHRARLALVIFGIEAWEPSRSALANHLASRVDHVIAISRYSSERFVSWSGVAAHKIFLLPPCVDLDRFQPRKPDRDLVARYGLHNDKIILTMGRLVSRERCKGFDEVIDVMPQLLSRFPTLKYFIVGEGPDLPRLKAKAAAMGVSHAVVFAGYVPESQKVAHYSLADAYVMPSSGEGFGIVLIEAAACGIPVIGSKADGSRDALLDGALGTLIDPREPNELLEAVTRVIVESPKHERLKAVESFSVSDFRARVADWVEAEICTRRSPKAGTISVLAGERSI